MKINAILLFTLMLFGLTAQAIAGTTHANSTTGVQGYDLVSYHSNNGPVKGNGHHLSVHDGVTYLFASKENKQTFDKNPEKYIPAYGGYCAYGVSVGKKFVGDAEVWKVVNGTLYLNLDKNVQKEWEKDIPGRIAAADKHWKNIKDASPESL